MWFLRELVAGQPLNSRTWRTFSLYLWWSTHSSKTAIAFYHPYKLNRHFRRICLFEPLLLCYLRLHHCLCRVDSVIFRWTVEPIHRVVGAPTENYPRSFWFPWTCYCPGLMLRARQIETVHEKIRRTHDENRPEQAHYHYRPYRKKILRLRKRWEP